MRGHRDSTDLDAYRQFVAEVFERLNGRVAHKFNEERKPLNSLFDRGYRVHFTRTSDLVQRLQAVRREMRLPAISPSWTASIC